eukprot:jgi/Mesvir1/19629/Mv09917-RA.4
MASDSPQPMDIASEAEEMAAMDRVLTRLALTEENKLEKVLEKLLPRIIPQVETKYEAVKRKVMEILSHINNRVRGQMSIKLPLQSLIEQYTSGEGGAMAKSFAIIYVEMAMDRSSPENKWDAVPLLLQGVSTRPAQHQDILLRLAVQAMEICGSEHGFPTSLLGNAVSAAAALEKKLPFVAVEADRDALLAYALECLLYMRTGAAEDGTPVAPPGMSLEQAKRVMGKEPIPVDVLPKRKLGILNVLAELNLAPALVYRHFMVASNDGDHRVARRGEELFKRRAASADLEDAALVKSLFALYIGNSHLARLPAEQKISPASPSLKVLLMSSFTRSVLAANSFPSTLHPIFDCIYGANTTPRLKQMGMEFAVWTFKHARDDQLQLLAPIVLDGMIKLLKSGEPEQADTATSQLRGFTYSAIAQLASRSPQLFSSQMDLCRQFFGALNREPPPVRPNVQAAVSALAAAFKGASAQVMEQVEELMLTHGEKGEGPSKFCAVQWANQLFPFSNPTARYVCLLAAGDSKLDVREEGKKGLLPPIAKNASGDKAASAPASSNAMLDPATRNAAILASATQYPTVAEMVRYIWRRNRAVARPVENNERVLLYPAPTYCAILRFLDDCRVADAEKGTQQGLPSAAAASSSAMARDEDAEGGPSTTDGARGLPPADAGLVLQRLVEHALAKDGTSELAVAATGSLLEVANIDIEAFASLYTPRLTPWLLPLLSHIDIAVRENVARMIGIVTTKLSPEATQSLLYDLRQKVLGPGGVAAASTGSASTSTASGAGAGASSSAPGSSATAAGSSSLPSSSSSSAKAKYEDVHGGLLAIGYVLAQCAMGQPQLPHGTLEEFTSLLVSSMRHEVALLAATAAEALGLEGLRRPLPLPLGKLPEEGASKAGDKADTTSPPAGAGSATAPPSAAGTSAPAASATTADGAKTASSSLDLPGDIPAASVAAQVAAASKESSSAPSGSGVGVTPPGPVAPTRASAAAGLAEMLADGTKDAKVAHKAGLALGRMAFGERDAELLAFITGKLLAMATNKNEDLLFVLGEALAFAMGAVPVPVDNILRAPPLAASLSNAAVAGGRSRGGAGAQGGPAEGPAGETVRASADVAMAEAGEGAGSAGGAAVEEDRDKCQARILETLLGELLVNPRKEMRASGAIWSVSLLAFCGHQAQVQARLPRFQEAFSSLLGDASELTQEVASRGMSLVYELGDTATRERLVQDLVGTLAGTSRKKEAIKVTDDTEVFQAGALGSAPGGGSLSTYKELCSLANEMGQPDMLYKFMDLANHAASLASKRGAAFGFADIAKQAGRQLDAHLPQLLPKLFRLQFDPNPRIAEAMGHIWKALVPDTRKAVDQYFGKILEELTGQMGSRLWRSREGACAALGDLLQGRPARDVLPHLESVWTMSFRALDDIKESVRVAAGILSRTVASLSIRVCDVAQTSPAEASQALAIVLPLLLDKGMSSEVAEVRGLSVRTIMKIVKGAGPSVRPHIPKLATAMLESLSNLEDARLNYVEMHAAKMNLSTDKLESGRIAASKDSPMWDTLDLCLRQVDTSTAEALVPRLCQLVRSGVGLNTRAGTARFVGQLSARLRGDLRPHTQALIKAFQTAMGSERSKAVRQAFASAIASCLPFAADSRQEKVIQETLALYHEPGDADARWCSAQLIREIARGAGDVLQKYSSDVLPLAFFARQDEEAPVASLWSEVWEENSSSQAATVRLHLGEISTLCHQGLVSSSWGRKKQAAKAVKSLAEAVGTPGDASSGNGAGGGGGGGGESVLQPRAHELARTLLGELPGRLWDGKETLLDALGALVKACGGAAFGSSGAPLLLLLLLQRAVCGQWTRRR